MHISRRRACARVTRIAWILVMLLVAIGAPRVSQAQERSGHIYGQVTDASGGVLVGVTVVITDTLTGAERVIVTNSEGNYSAPRLQTGDYRVQVEFPGFKKFARAGVVLGAGAVAQINVQLETGDVAEVVEVVNNAPLINATSGVVRTSIEQVFIDRLPLAGRNANDLMKIIPGVVSGVGGGGALADNYSANGNRDTSNNFTLDGTENADIWNSKSSRIPSPDALQEFTVQSNYSAEYGRGSGVAVIAMTKSGTNKLHGSLYDYFQADELNANSFQRNQQGLPKGNFQQHQWGVTTGGPLTIPGLYNGLNRTFFFFHHQRLSTPETSYLWRRGGLTAAELSGDFSQSATRPVISSAAAAQPNSPFAGMAGRTLTDLRPYLSSAAVRWYGIHDLPIMQTSGQEIFESRSASLSQPEYTARLDHRLGRNHNLSFSMFHRKNMPSLRLVNGGPEQFQTGDQDTQQHYAVSEVWTINPRMVNEVLLGYGRIWDTRHAEFGDVNYGELGYPYPSVSPNQWVGITSDLSPSAFNIGAPNGKYQGRDVLDMRNTLSMNRGAHFMKGGVTVMLQNINTTNYANQEYNFDGAWLGNRAAEFLIGWPRSMSSVRSPFYRNARRTVFNAFFQNDWRVSPQLTLNMGLRYEPQIWAYLKNDQGLIFVPGASSPQPNFPSGVLLVTDPGSPGRGGRANDMNNWAPRLGAAYSLDAEARSVIRAGWGLYYDVLPGGGGGRDGIGVAAAFPFIHQYSATFNRGYPGSPDAWLNIFAYDGIPIPDLTKPVDVRTAVFNPNSTFGTYVPDGEMGYSHQFNVTFERTFGKDWLGSAAYIGNRGVNLFGAAFWNVPVSRDENDSLNAENLASRRPIQEYRLQTRAYNPGNGKSQYDAAQFTLRARKGTFNMSSHYTYSRTFANLDGVFALERSHPDDLDVDWARSLMDIPHRFVSTLSWDLPLFRDQNTLAGRILGGWAATAIVQAQSGRVTNIVAAQNNTFTCTQCVIRPNPTGQPMTFENWREDPNLLFINVAAFSQPANRTYGTLERNAIRGPSTKNVDFSLLKSFRVHGPQKRVDLRFDFFNLFNWTNFTLPNSINLGGNAANFSMRNFAGGPRTMQIGARFAF